MQDEMSPRPAQKCVGATASLDRSSDDDPQRPEQKVFRLDVHPDDVALMVRFRHAVRDDDTQVRILAGVEQISCVRTPADYVVDAIDVIGTRWDGQNTGGMHRVVCLLERTPDVRSGLRHLIVIGQGGAIAIPPVDSDVRNLTDFRVVYAQGSALLPP
jgi:hypothetical protein